MFVTQTVIPVIVAPVLFGEYFDTTPLSGWPLVASLTLLVAGAAALARSPLLLAMMEPQAASVSTSSDSVASPRADSSETMPFEPEQRRGRSRPLRRRARRRRGSAAEAAVSSPCSCIAPLTGVAAVGAREHELADREPAGRLHVVEAVVDAERVRLFVEHRARLDPAQR